MSTEGVIEIEPGQEALALFFGRMRCRDRLVVGRSDFCDVIVVHVADEQLEIVREGDRWMVDTDDATHINGVQFTTRRALNDRDRIELPGGPSFHFRLMPADPILGAASWLSPRGDVMFETTFRTRLAWRAIAMNDYDAPRLIGARLEYEPRTNLPRIGLIEDVDGPTVDDILARTAQQRAQLDPAIANAIAQSVDEYHVTMRDVVVTWSGRVVVVGDRWPRSNMTPDAWFLLRFSESGAQLRGDGVASQSDLAAFVRALFPDEARAHQELSEQIPLLEADGWRSRVPR